jgi:hypothetical protein
VAGQQQDVDEKDGDQEESAEEVMGLESKDSFFAGWVGRWDVAFVIAFVHGLSMSPLWCGAEAGVRFRLRFLTGEEGFGSSGGD